MTDTRSTTPTVGTPGRLGLLATALLLATAACSSGADEATPTATPPGLPATAAPAVTEAPAVGAESEPPGVDASAGTTVAPTDDAVAALDFGSGSGSITLQGVTHEFTIGPGAGLCRDVFGIIQAAGQLEGDPYIEGTFTIPPLDWATYTDGRYDPPSVELEITTNGPGTGDWIADASWAEETGKVGMSQVDAYEKDGQTASGTATFADALDSEAESIQGSFEISCDEG